MSIRSLFEEFGLPASLLEGGTLSVTSPIDGAVIAQVREDTPDSLTQKLAAAQASFRAWRSVPAPARGELVRLFGEELRAHKDALGRLVTIENGKILSEGLGEVQEMIDICDLAVGQSRQLFGLTIASERPGHHMLERWHPLGPVAVISAFNFPVAVWSWNTTLALICGNPVLWKPSEKTPLTAMACQALLDRALARYTDAPSDATTGLASLVIGGRDLGEALTQDPRIALVSATGSTAMGRQVAPVAAKDFRRSLLELGGNAAMIVTPSADLDLATRAIVFSAVGTAGQRCTTLRRLIVHTSIYGDLIGRLKAAYGSLRIGNPLLDTTLVGPLIDRQAFETMEAALAQARDQGGTVHGGGRVSDEGGPEAYYARPALVEMPTQSEIVRTETFAPILYAMGYEAFEDALALHNGVPQGLSSCIFTTDLREAERFLSAEGSDCGIANVNIGPSGAEIGGAFGGEKETGGGRESGSDAWKAYMRRQTQTVNYSTALPLAQGVKFDL